MGERIRRELQREAGGRTTRAGLFTSLAEAKVLVEQYRLEYNHARPHSSLAYQTPAEFAASCDLLNGASAAGAATAFDHPPEGETEEIRSDPALSH